MRNVLEAADIGQCKFQSTDKQGVRIMTILFHSQSEECHSMLSEHQLLLGELIEAHPCVYISI